jgi:hypothetical protein
MGPWSKTALLAWMTYAASCFGQSSHADPNWRQECTSALAAPLEQPAIQTPWTAEKLAGCDETDTYYGIRGEPDYPAALACGWYERAHPKPAATMFYGPGVLTMLYANGQAGARNYDLAIRMACEQKATSQEEMALSIGHLEAMRAGNTDPGRFDLCEDITSGPSMGSCASIQTRRADAKREQEIAAAIAKLPDSAKNAFAKLREAEKAFEEARSANEVDLSGTARGMFALQEEKKLRDEFLMNLLRFAGDDVPQTSATQFATVDRALKTTYDQIERLPSAEWHFGTIKPEGIRETQRVWTGLVDAWVEFAARAYPNVDATTVRAQIVRTRLRQLRVLVPRVG